MLKKIWQPFQRRLHPDFCFQSLTHLSPAWFSRNFQGLILDVDNTLVSRREDVPRPEFLAWLQKLKKAQVRIVLVSNNGGRRGRILTDFLQLPLITWAAKPLPIGLRKAIQLLHLPQEKILVVGDQLFTDVLGAHNLGLKAAWVQPLDDADFIVTAGMRILEKKLRSRWQPPNPWQLKEPQR